MWTVKIILHPTDFSSSSEDAFRLACSLARDHGARLIVLHVTSVPDLAYEGFGAPGAPIFAEEYLAKARRDLEEIQCSEPALAFERVLEEGDPVAEIVRVARERAVDLIVMGTHGQTGLRHLLMGSVAERVVRQALCPVLTLKTPRDSLRNGA